MLVLQLSKSQDSGGYKSKGIESSMTGCASVNMGLPAEHWNEGLDYRRSIDRGQTFRRAIPVGKRTRM